MQYELPGQYVPNRLLVACVTGALLTACTAPETIEAAPENPAVTEFRQFAELPKNACGKYQAYSGVYERSRETAEACLRALDGRLVIVDFSEAEDIETTADQVEAVLPAITGDIVHPTVDVVEASPQAYEAFLRARADGCDRGLMQLPVDFAAYAAHSTMPGLAAYDGVIAVQDEQVCSTSNALGLADTESRWLADVETRNERGEQYSEPERVFITAHEILHLYGLGHAGKLLVNMPARDYGEDLYGNDITVQSSSLDLDTYTAGPQSNFNEYGDTNSIMGNDTSKLPDGAALRPVHQATLQQPESDVADTSPRMRDATEQAVTITSAEQGAVAEVWLNRALTITAVGLNREQTYHSYIRLAVVPLSEDGSRIDGAELALINEYNDYITLGELRHQDDRDSTFTITSGANIVQLQFEGDQLTVINI